MGKIKILKTGLLTTIQDTGRRGYQKYGVPVSGAMDKYSHKLANILVDNNPKEATLEINMLGPKIQFMSDECISITGADLQPKINENPVEMYKSIYIKKGSILSFGGMKKGLRSYIAFAGGMAVEKVMGSKSYYSKADLGTKIEANKIININSSNKNIKRQVGDKFIPEIKNKTKLRVVLGPQIDYFTKKGIDTFLNNTYQITNNSDRMGYRLEGDAIEHKNKADIISDGLSRGAVQVPGSKKPIIMMSDCQTTGGYAKIGYIIKEDIDKLAQLKPGNKVEFEKISINEAQKIYRKYSKKIDTIKKKLKSKNNISGVIKLFKKLKSLFN